MLIMYSNFMLVFAFVAIVKGQAGFRPDYTYLREHKMWYKVHHIPASWKDAMLRCRFEGATLAIPMRNCIPGSFLSTITNSIEDDEFLMGVHATISEGDFFSFNGQTLEETLKETKMDWGGYEKHGNESCTGVEGESEVLRVVPCETECRYVCFRRCDPETKYDEKCGTTDPEYYMDMRSGFCYKFHVIPRIFSRAFMVCAAEGGQLFKLEQEVEETILQEIFTKYPTSLIIGTSTKTFTYVGVHDWDEPGDFLTIDGEPISSTLWQWAAKEPNNSSSGEHCGAAGRNGRLYDVACDTPAPFLCKKHAATYHDDDWVF